MLTGGNESSLGSREAIGVAEEVQGHLGAVRADEEDVRMGYDSSRAEGCFFSAHIERPTPALISTFEVGQRKSVRAGLGAVVIDPEPWLQRSAKDGCVPWEKT